MGGRKVTIIFDEADYKKLANEAKKNGLGRVSTLIRYVAVNALNDSEKEQPDKSVVKVNVTNYRELAGYVEQKKLGSVAVFASFSMEQQMQRVPLTPQQKERVEKSIE